MHLCRPESLLRPVEDTDGPKNAVSDCRTSAGDVRGCFVRGCSGGGAVAMCRGSCFGRSISVQKEAEIFSFIFLIGIFTKKFSLKNITFSSSQHHDTQFVTYDIYPM